MPIQYSLAAAAIVCGSHTHAHMQGRTSGSVQLLFQRTTVINGTHVRKFLITLISHRSRKLHQIKKLSREQAGHQGWGARPYAGLSLLKVEPRAGGARRFKLNTNSNGADTAYICKHSAYLHTQKCAHNVGTQIILKVHSE